MQRMQSKKANRMATSIALTAILMVAITASVTWGVMAIVHAHQIPAKYRTGVWLKIGNQYIAANRDKTVCVDPVPNQMYGSTSASTNNFQKYWFKAELPDGSMPPIKKLRSVPITIHDDKEMRDFQILDRKTGKCLSYNRITFRIRK